MVPSLISSFVFYSVCLAVVGSGITHAVRYTDSEVQDFFYCFDLDIIFLPFGYG